MIQLSQNKELCLEIDKICLRIYLAAVSDDRSEEAVAHARLNQTAKILKILDVVVSSSYYFGARAAAVRGEHLHKAGVKEVSGQLVIQHVTSVPFERQF